MEDSVKTALTLVSQAIDEPIIISKDSSTFIDQLDELLQPGSSSSYDDMLELEKQLKILIFKADEIRVHDVQGRLERGKKLLDVQEGDQHVDQKEYDEKSGPSRIEEAIQDQTTELWHKQEDFEIEFKEIPLINEITLEKDEQNKIALPKLLEVSSKADLEETHVTALELGQNNEIMVETGRYNKIPLMNELNVEKDEQVVVALEETLTRKLELGQDYEITLETAITDYELQDAHAVDQNLEKSHDCKASEKLKTIVENIIEDQVEKKDFQDLELPSVASFSAQRGEEEDKRIINEGDKKNEYAEEMVAGSEGTLTLTSEVESVAEAGQNKQNVEQTNNSCNIKSGSKQTENGTIKAAAGAAEIYTPDLPLDANNNTRNNDFKDEPTNTGPKVVTSSAEQEKHCCCVIM